MKFIKKIKKLIYSPERYAKTLGVRIGKGCLIADKDTFPSEGYLVEIGNNSQLTIGTRIFTHGGAQVARLQHPNFDTFGKVKIGNYVYVGSNSIIMPGVSIGNNVLICAGSVVTKSVDSGYVVGGNPAKIICSTEEYIKRNLQYNTNTKNYSHKEKMKYLLNQGREKIITKGYMKPPIITHDKKK